jgi:hypothetical protein
VDRRRQPPLMVMPDELTDLPEHVRNGVEGCRPLDLGFEPLPEALERIVLRGIRLQVLQFNPGVLLEKVFDRATFVNLGIGEAHEEQRLGKALVELVEKCQERLGRPSLGPFPVETLSPEMQGPEQRGALALGRGGDFGLCAFAPPPALDVGCIGKV